MSKRVRTRGITHALPPAWGPARRRSPADARSCLAAVGPAGRWPPARPPAPGTWSRRAGPGPTTGAGCGTASHCWRSPDPRTARPPRWAPGTCTAAAAPRSAWRTACLLRNPPATASAPLPSSACSGGGGAQRRRLLLLPPILSSAWERDSLLCSGRPRRVICCPRCRCVFLQSKEVVF